MWGESHAARHACLSSALITGCLLLVSGCSIVELDKLVPSSAIDAATSDPSLLSYVPNACPSPVVTQIFEHHAELLSRAQRLQTVLPQPLAQDPVVNAVVNHALYVSYRGMQSASLVIKNSPPVSPSAKPPTSIGPAEIFNFSKIVMDHAVRHTPSAQPGQIADRATANFWNNLSAYYDTYFKNKFYNYLGVTLPAPSPSLAISDAEIVQTVQVFIEFLLDEIFHSPLWTSKDMSDKNIYPGGTTHPPTYAIVNKITPTPVSAALPGCGMSVPKAKAIAYLVSQFSTAAATEVGLLVKSTGGVEVGLGIIGKLSIGDNNLLAELAKGVAAEVVSRLTVVLAVPILSAIDFEQQQAVVAKVQVPLAGMRRSTPTQRASQLRLLISPFVSPNLKPL